MSNLKLEVGKFYRTRNGQKAECIYCKPEGLGPNKKYQCIILFESGEHLSYMQNGDYLVNGQENYADIISEWKETPEETSKRIGFDPTCLPAWGIWISMIDNGKWVHFNNEPESIKTIFYSETEYAGRIPDEYAPKNFTGHWTESKFKVK